jgi:hypothetical protein
MIAPGPMKRTLKICALLLALLALSTSCAREPSTKRSTKILRHHFKKYAKKYPDTEYGRHGVTEVEVTGQNEIHKHLVAVESFITLGDGSVQRIYATVEKGPMGWRFVSWEKVGGT